MNFQFYYARHLRTPFFAFNGYFMSSVLHLQMSRKDLLALDFEGILKYFRVHMPKKYRTEEAARELMAAAVSAKVNLM